MSKPTEAGKDAVAQQRAEWLKEEARERAQVEAERMELYEGGPLPDANFFDHDQD